MFIYTIGDIIQVIYLSIVALFLLGVGGYVLYQEIKLYIKQKKCKHEKYYETMSCDAICSICGKNLGFIQPIREKNPRGERR